MFLFDGARFLTRAFLYLSVIGTRCEVCAIKCPENKKIVACNLLHEIMNARKGLNNVPCVVWSCNKLHATSDGARFLTRAFLYQSVIGTRCEACAIKCPENKRIVACNLLHEIVNAPKGLNNVPCVVWSCIKMHATYEIVNAERVE